MTNIPPNQPLPFAMIGGGTGSFIGAVHRRAAVLDHGATLVAGALSSTPQRARESAREIGLPEDRAYDTWQALLESESKRPEAERPRFISIVTPNDSHFEIATAALNAGFHVVLDKPMVHTSEQAQHLIDLVNRTGLILAVTYNYTGYPMVKQAAKLIRDGALGKVRKVFVEYHQGWLATKLEATGMKQAAWRTDPKRAGLGGSLGDIGSHAENLLTTITGLELDSLCADCTSFVEGRQLDDDAAVLLRFKGGAKGLLTCSQVCIGEGNNLSIRVYGSEGGIVWRQEDAERLEFTPRDKEKRIYTKGGVLVGDEANNASRLPEGHPEGFLEAFANVYKGVIDAIRARDAGTQPTGLATEFPTVHDGARGVRFIEKAVESSKKGGVWVEF